MTEPVPRRILSTILQLISQELVESIMPHSQRWMKQPHSDFPCIDVNSIAWLHGKYK
jgi:hypothetical protein